MPNPIVHFEIIGKDGKKLQEFFGGVFDWKVDADNPMNYGIVEAQGGGIGGGITAAMPGNDGGVTVYVAVPDPDATLQKVTQMGGKVVMPTTEIPGQNLTIAQFTDPEGHLIGLIKA
jgi:predicted enzyme related to lactoylglutathione lyase